MIKPPNSLIKSCLTWLLRSWQPLGQLQQNQLQGLRPQHGLGLTNVPQARTMHFPLLSFARKVLHSRSRAEGLMRKVKTVGLQQTPLAGGTSHSTAQSTTVRILNVSEHLQTIADELGLVL